MKLSFTAFHRRKYWDYTLRTWSRVRGIEDIDITVFLESSPMRLEMASIAGQILPHALVQINEPPYGVLRNPWEAHQAAFTSGVDFSILGEDDVIVSTDVLEYFSWARDEFRDDSEVLAVCAFDSHLGEFGPGDVTKQRWFSPLVWGTWANRWELILRDTWDFDYRNGGWDWNIFRRAIVTNEMFCVFPRNSRSTHIGKYKGVHMTTDEFPRSLAGTFVEPRRETEYRLVGYLDFWGGELFQDHPPLAPEGA